MFRGQVHISESHLKIAASGQVLLEGDWEFKAGHCDEVASAFRMSWAS